MTLAAMIARAYPTPEWAVFFEVSNGTGANARRRADAVALGVWPSRGHSLIGFEFKEDRRDWLREKANPEKAELVASHCDFWNVVIGTEGVAKIEELPEPWGLLQANKDRSTLLTIKAAAPFPDRDKAVMRRSFVAAMLRKVAETTVPHATLHQRIDEAVKIAVDRTSAGHELKTLQQTVERQRQVIQTFKQITGVDLEGWRGHVNISKAVDAVLNLDNDREQLERAASGLERASNDIRSVLREWIAREPAILEAGAIEAKAGA